MHCVTTIKVINIEIGCLKYINICGNSQKKKL